MLSNQTPEALFQTSVSNAGKNDELGPGLFLNRRKTELFSSEIDTKPTKSSNKVSLISKKKSIEKPILGSKKSDTKLDSGISSDDMISNSYNLARYGSDGSLKLYVPQKKDKDKPHSKNKSTFQFFKSIEDQSTKNTGFDGLSHQQSGDQFFRLFETR
jgi:hypothetical protein